MVCGTSQIGGRNERKEKRGPRLEPEGRLAALLVLGLVL